MKPLCTILMYGNIKIVKQYKKYNFILDKCYEEEAYGNVISAQLIFNLLDGPQK
jgi:hypothetical protein